MKREVAVGLGLAVVTFLAVRGVDLLPLLFFGGLVYFLFRTTGGLPGLPRRFVPLQQGGAAGTQVSFDDVGGQASAKKELAEALEFVANQEAIRKLGIRPLKGILLTGPPGTGKTLLAKAAATYTRSAFIAASGSEFIEMYAGVGAQRVRDLFRRARDLARQGGRASAIIFIDELEVLGGKRGAHQSHLEYDQTLNQLLVEMDGIQGGGEVRLLVIGATNRPDLLDDALLRPGRFDRIVKVELPDREDRRHILALHTQNKPLAEDVDLDRLARETFGFSGAHLESLANEAAILALRDGSDRIGEAHFREAIEKVIMGEKLDRRPSDEELYRIAIHEAGHALVGELVQPGSVASIAIASRGAALGYVRQAPGDDRYLYTKDYLEGEIARCLAGAVAEEIVFGERSTGAANDYRQAIDLAKRLIGAGMSRLGVVDVEGLPERLRHRVLSEILAQREGWVRERIESHQEGLQRVARRLLEEERLSGEELRRLLGLPGLPEAREDSPVEGPAAEEDRAAS